MYRVFVVDDEQVIATTLGLILERHGYAATCFSDPVELLKAARRDPPAVVISDVIMPEMNGVELALQLRAALPGCKVLLLSGQAASSDLLQAVPAHETPPMLLSKPIHPETLLRHLRALTADAA